MYVLADLEWTNLQTGDPFPTQIALLRVDAAWNPIDSFYARIRPIEDVADWTFCAYAGGTAADFLFADPLSEVERRLADWRAENDILCWWFQESEYLFRSFFPAGKQWPAVCVQRCRIEGFQNSKGRCRGSYRLARRLLTDQAAQAAIPSPAHYSPNDAETMRLALCAAGFAQARLAFCPPALGKDGEMFQTPFVYDAVANVIHERGCELLGMGGALKGVATLKLAFRKAAKPCKCCAELYRRAVAQRNLDIISRSNFRYLYTPGSTVFHTRTCKAMLSAREIRGMGRYERCLRKGLRPCKRCKPTPDDVSRTAATPKPSAKTLQQSPPKPRQKRPKPLSFQSAVQVSLDRFREARAEREAGVRRADMSEAERRAFLTLTHPGYAFWAARGYGNFHTRACRKLKGLSSLTGFARYADAAGAGLSPCKLCKPSRKQDVRYPVPIDSRERKGETVQTLVRLCDSQGYPIPWIKRTACSVWKRRSGNGGSSFPRSRSCWNISTSPAPGAPRRTTTASQGCPSR